MLGEQTKTILLVLAMLVIAYVLIRRIYRRTGRSSNRPIVEQPRPQEQRRGQALMDAPPEVLRWQVEMHDTARELIAELNNKMAALDFLARQAAEQASRLEQALEQARELGVGPSAAEAGEITRLAAALRESATRPTTDPADTGLPTPLAPETIRPTIYRLADSGQTPAMIADAIDQPVAEVERILSEREST